MQSIEKRVSQRLSHLGHEGEEDDRATRRCVEADQREPGDDADPLLERADVENGRVGDGEQQQEQIDRLASHTGSQ